MGLLDWAVAAALGAMVVWPWVAPRVAALVTARTAAPAAKPAVGGSIEGWRQSWSSTLISLIDEIESGEAHFEDDKAAVKLAKELLWEVIGGDGSIPSKGK